ncbi:PsiF family protein [Rhodoferax saidenbachensis]|uniref:Phosphate starvation-inducible protein PsiF n=1 Tax=Rhodoferax saidenbachensis TaxID=1484693 RepID=A0A1P8K670_9BURK|nr:PsiF family protein [Rhodoferax saidenbachensis]APW41479.1 phosphate starvation-inducible protein PsiF [Rhodoferax saidenbachensis]
MKQLISLMALGLALAVGGAHAADEKAPTAQQNKMKTCNADAKTKDLKGDERKAFMKECLSAKKEAAPAADGATAQQSKMKTCNADPKAKTLKGDERKKFMSECLKG